MFIRYRPNNLIGPYMMRDIEVKKYDLPVITTMIVVKNNIGSYFIEDIALNITVEVRRKNEIKNWYIVDFNYEDVEYMLYCDWYYKGHRGLKYVHKRNLVDHSDYSCYEDDLL